MLADGLHHAFAPPLAQVFRLSVFLLHFIADQGGSKLFLMRLDRSSHQVRSLEAISSASLLKKSQIKPHKFWQPLLHDI